MLKTPSPMLLSIIIPCLNEQSNVQACLQQLQRLRSRGVELIVVDGGSKDSTVEFARPWADEVLTSSRGRAVQMNLGARRAIGEWLLFLHTDTELPKDFSQWLDQLDSVVGCWGFFPLRLSGGQLAFRIIETAICWRSRLTSIATGDQCQFVRRKVFERQRGFKDIPLMEDIELSGRLRRESKPAVWCSPVTTSSRRWLQNGIVSTVLLMWCLRIAFFVGVSPACLYRWYYQRGHSSLTTEESG